MAMKNVQAVGKVVLVYGSVKAVSAAGFERVLTPNSVIYANERIVTGPDGSASVTFFHSPNQLVLGRMSDVAIDEDVYGGAGAAGDAVAQVQDIQSALQQDGGLDPTVDLPPPAAGAGVAGSDPRGGGRQIVIFEADQMEVTPDSGAETRGIELTFLDPPPGALPEEETAFAAAPPPVVDIDNALPTLAVGNQSVSEIGELQSVTGLFALNYGADGTGSLVLSAAGAMWDADARTLTGPNNSWVLVVNDNGTYNFTQLTALQHGPDGSATDDALDIVVTATVTDSDGDSVSRDLTITVGDDGPTLTVGSVGVNESGLLSSPTGISVSGDLNVAYGADGPGSLALSAAGASWDAGTRTLTGPGNAWVLVVNDNGTYTFTQLAALQHGPDGSATDDALDIVVTATVTDGDGDSVNRDLTITVTDHGPTLTVSSFRQIADADVGTPNDAVIGTLNYPFGVDGPGSLVLSATGATWDPGAFRLIGANDAWIIQVNGNGTYTFTLLSPMTHGGPGSETDGALDIAVTATVTDSDGDSVTLPITIRVIDDVPQAVDDSNSISSNATTAITDNVLTNDHIGADTPANLTSVVSWEDKPSTYGTFTGMGDGTYTYIVDPANAAVLGLPAGQTLTETFSYTMQDADGDPSSAMLTITITGTNDVPTISVDPGAGSGNDVVYESGLPQGSDASAMSEYATGTFTLSDADGLDDIDSVTINGQVIPIANLGTNNVIAGTNGILTITTYDPVAGVANYTYQLTSAAQDGAGTETDVFTLTTTDGTATSTPATITIEIADDVPQAVDDSNSISSNATTAIIGNVLTNDVHANGQPGADTPTSFVSWANTAATYGTFTDTGSGTYSYVVDPANAAVLGLPAGQTLTETFSYTMQDADGDPSSATLTITITGTNAAPTIAIWNDSNDNGTYETTLDNQVETITVNIATDSNMPVTHNVFIGDALSESVPLTSEQLNSNPPLNTVLAYASDLTVTFLFEGAGYQSTVGWYDVNNPSVGHIIWANASAVDSGGNLVPGTSQALISNVPAGVQLGFFLIPDGYSLNAGLVDGETVYFRDGHAYADSSYTQLLLSDDNGMGGANPTWFSNPVNSDTSNLDGLQHAISGVGSGDNHTLFVGFEDLGNGGDADYNDVVFSVYLGEQNIVQINPTSFDVGVSIADTDSATLSRAVLSFELGNGDIVTYTPITGLNVVQNGNEYTITGDASIEAYNTLLDSFHITVGHSGANENYQEIDPVTRSASLQVWDASGTASTQETAHFDVQLNVVGSTGNEELIGGAGNDILTGGAGADVFKVGNGHDTITDYNRADGDTVDISDVLDTAADDVSRLDLANNGGKAQLAIYDNANHDNMIGSVTFDNIEYHDGDTLGSLLGQIDLDHTK